MSFPEFVLVSLVFLVYATAKDLKEGKSVGYAITYPIWALSLSMFVISLIGPGSIPLSPEILGILPIISVLAFITSVICEIIERNK